MLIKLKHGLTLSVPDNTPREALRKPGYFVLDGNPCSIPDLSITPAFYIVCEEPSDDYELHQYEVILGSSAEIV